MHFNITSVRPKAKNAIKIQDEDTDVKLKIPNFKGFYTKDFTNPKETLNKIP